MTFNQVALLFLGFTYLKTNTPSLEFAILLLLALYFILSVIEALKKEDGNTK